LNIGRHDLELICQPDKIPDEIAIDVTGLEVCASIHISHVNLPAGTKSAITDRDFTIATIVAPSGLRSEEGDNSKTESGE
jgi:large subunit ribosomal protein L25